MENNSTGRIAKSADELKKTDMSVKDVVFMVFCLVAAGCFGIEEMVSVGGPGLSILLLVLFPVIWALPISEMTAELGSVMPSAGGPYIWCRETMGEFWGWQVGFWAGITTWLSQAEYCALVAGYVEKFIALTPTQVYFVKVAMVLIFTAVNLRGVKEVSILDNIFAIIMLAAFAAVAAVGFAHWNYNPVEPFFNKEEGIVGSVGGSLAVVIWMYCGYECMSNVSQEVKDPQVIPKGMMAAQPVIAASYLIPTIAALAAVGSWSVWSTESGGGHVGYMDVLINYVGPWAGVAFLIVAIVSNCSIFNAYFIAGSRAFFVMADEHMFPPFLTRVSKRRGVPHVAIIILAAFTIVCCQFSFKTLVMAATPLQLYIYMTMSVATRRMRKLYPVEERKKKGLFVMHGGKFGFNFMTLMPFVVAVAALYCNGTDYFLMGFVVLAIGLAMYIVFKMVYKGRSIDDPAEYPLSKKTKLGVGDLSAIGTFLFISGLIALAGRFILAWYEGGDGTAYYAEENTGVLGNFNEMLAICLWIGIILLAVGALLWCLGKQYEGNELKEIKVKRTAALYRLISRLQGWERTELNKTEHVDHGDDDDDQTIKPPADRREKQEPTPTDDE